MAPFDVAGRHRDAALPYTGTAGAPQASVDGRIKVLFDVSAAEPPVARREHQDAGRDRAERIPAAAGVATMADSGVPDFISGTWPGFVAPARTPKEIVDRVAAEARKALADPAMKAKLAEQGIVAVGNSPDEYRAFVAAEIARWAKVIKDANIKAVE